MTTRSSDEIAEAIAAHALGIRPGRNSCDMCGLHQVREIQQRGVIAEMDRQFLLAGAKLDKARRLISWLWLGWLAAVLFLCALWRQA